MQFFLRSLLPKLQELRENLGEFLGCSASELALMPNATHGINTVLKSYPFSPGDEIIVTNHGYNACNNAARFEADKQGVILKCVELPFPIKSPGEVLCKIEKALTKRTRLALIDHITSPTALVLPLQKIVSLLEARGVDTLVDGAHAPGQLALNLQSLGAAFYTGNCHKWLCSPKGTAFLFVREDKQIEIRPLAISHGMNAPGGEKSLFRNEFDWQGTHDPSAHLAIPTALTEIAGWVQDGWDGVRNHNRSLNLRARSLLCDALEISLPCPDEMVGHMAAFPIACGEMHGTLGDMGLQSMLMERFKIEVPVFDEPYSPLKTLRISAQLYNDISQYEYLANALVEIENTHRVKLGLHANAPR